MSAEIFDLESGTDLDEEVVWATVILLGVPHHVCAIRVEQRDDRQEPVRDPNDRYGLLCDVDSGGEFQTVNLPGRDGDWVLVVTPYQR